VQDFVYAGCDALATLQEVHATLCERRPRDQ
jgi:hypothetical protein